MERVSSRSRFGSDARERARSIVIDQKNKPVLDEQTFEKLLEAAYVLQEHNRKMKLLEESLEFQSEQLREQELANQSLLQRLHPESESSTPANTDYTLTLAQIVEAQHQIQAHHLGLDQAMGVVADKVMRITGASGAGIAIMTGKMVRYRAGAGPSALPAGSEVPLQSAVCQANLRTGQVIRTEDMNTEFLFDPDPCRARGILSLIAVPIYHDSDIVGSLELYSDKIRGFAEQDIHTCQLMAGLVTEAIGRDAELKLRNSMATERSTMLAAMEKLKPNLAVLAGEGPTPDSASASTASPAKISCWKCGNDLLEEEQFCGKCGASRASQGKPSSMQSKFASAWNMHQSGRQTFASTMPGAHTVDRKSWEDSPDDVAEDNTLARVPFVKLEPTSDQDAMSLSETQLEQDIEASSTAMVKPRQEDLVWNSAAKARDFLESLSGPRSPGTFARYWRSRRGDFYLALALILVAVVIRWGIWSDHSVGATGRGVAVSGSARSRRPVPDADLSVFDRLLVSLGLAEPPEAPEYKGNPDAQVWMDLHTALYYCSGSDLYGKTPKGKFASQRNAQLDQFEPANRKACD